MKIIIELKQKYILCKKQHDRSCLKAQMDFITWENYYTTSNGSPFGSTESNLFILDCITTRNNIGTCICNHGYHFCAEFRCMRNYFSRADFAEF